MKLGFIGYGAICKQALTALKDAAERPLEMVSILAKPDGVARAQALLDSLGPDLATRRIVVADIANFLELGPDLVAEAAGHESLARYGAQVLSSGCDLIITSVGALADEQLQAMIDQAACTGAARCLICPGAIGGLDIIAAAKLAGLAELIYTSRKSALAWRGTAAEHVVDLAALQKPFQFFEGTAREAARCYPLNANVAATVALHGAGFEKTLVRLIADPGATRNSHTIVMRSACADMEITIAGLPSPDNPRTSMTTGFALAAQIIRVLDAVARTRVAARP